MAGKTNLWLSQQFSMQADLARGVTQILGYFTKIGFQGNHMTGRQTYFYQNTKYALSFEKIDESNCLLRLSYGDKDSGRPDHESDAGFAIDVHIERGTASYILYCANGDQFQFKSPKKIMEFVGSLMSKNNDQQHLADQLKKWAGIDHNKTQAWAVEFIMPPAAI